MFKRLQKKIQTIRRQGLLRSVRMIADRLALQGLRRVYGFHPWHAEASLATRPYRRPLADMVNTMNPTCVVEVGCGLGVTLALVKTPQRWGYDREKSVIRAARFLRDKQINFVEGDLTSLTQDTIDVLILVNWIHDCSPEQLRDWLQPLLPQVRHLVLDAIDPDNPMNYTFTHDFAFLDQCASLILSVRPENEGRQFHLYEVTR